MNSIAENVSINKTKQKKKASFRYKLLKWKYWIILLILKSKNALYELKSYEHRNPFCRKFLKNRSITQKTNQHDKKTEITTLPNKLN